jgi:hypothetical protein
MLLPFLLLLLPLPPNLACYIQGQDSGTCVDTATILKDPEAAKMPFCGPLLRYPSVCLPKTYKLFPNNTWAAKDAWLHDFYDTTVNRLQQIEDAFKAGSVATLNLCALLPCCRDAARA